MSLCESTLALCQRMGDEEIRRQRDPATGYISHDCNPSLCKGYKSGTVCYVFAWNHREATCFERKLLISWGLYESASKFTVCLSFHRISLKQRLLPPFAPR